MSAPAWSEQTWQRALACLGVLIQFPAQGGEGTLKA